MHDDAFFFGFFNFFERGGHFVAAFQANQVHFARAHAQRRERDVDHFLGGNRRDVFCGRLEIFHAACMLRTTSRAAERATSMATFPPPITITFLPMVNLYPRFTLSRKSMPL